jgi:hypothetical protein
MLDRVEFKRTPRQQAGLMGVSCVLVAASWYLATTTLDPVYRVVGWLGVGLFVLCGGIAAKRMISGGTPFVFDRAGISFPGGNFGLVPWNEIKSYAVVTIRGNVFLALTFNDPERILSRVSAAKRKWALVNERMGWGHWALTFIGLTPGIDEAVEFIREHSLVQPANAMVK